jgi:hypothetical protein
MAWLKVATIADDESDPSCQEQYLNILCQLISSRWPLTESIVSPLFYVRRQMGSGFPTNLAVKKNKFVEEWNGKREITEKSFGIDFKTGLPTFIAYLVIVPLGIYTLSRQELMSKNDRRYNDVF